MENKPSVAHPENCSGCITCQLVCSFFNGQEGSFQPSRARIQVRRVGGLNRFRAELLPDCTGCGRCAEHCEYGVLLPTKEGGAA